MIAAAGACQPLRREKWWHAGWYHRTIATAVWPRPSGTHCMGVMGVRKVTRR